MIKEITAVIGEPGTGKTYHLTHKVNELLQNGEQVYIMNPTKSARNNVRKAFKNLLSNGEMNHENYEQAFRATNVLHGYQDNPVKNIFIDESAMVDLSNFYSLLYTTIDVADVSLYLYGDIKQIEPVQGDSILKTLIESSMSKHDKRTIWQFVADTLYNQMTDVTVNSPVSWKLDTPVNIKVLKKNHRLESKNFEGYNNDYYDSLIENANFIEDYSGLLRYCVENNWLITTPTNERGAEINDILNKQYDNPSEVAPFVKMNKDYYLNPFNKRYNELRQAFDFISEIERDSLTDYTFAYYMSTHRVQSFTVDNVCFFMGNNPIGNRYKKHYSNNLLYTAISRAKYEVQLLGNPLSFQQMRETMPRTSQEKNVHLRAGIAVKNLKRWIEQHEGKPTAEEIHTQYMMFYDDETLIPKHEKSILDVYKIQSEPYNIRYVINYINENYNGKFGFDLTNWLRENAKSTHKGNQRAKGKGRVQQWIESLSDEELEQVRADLSSRLVKKDEFRDRYDYTKEQVRKAII